MPTISVIIPAHNAEKTIVETIASVQTQTFSDFEIIVIDDGSTDQTLQVLQEILEPRLKVFSYENSGAAVARNRGISKAQGDYIAFLDADDLWVYDKLELQLLALQQRPAAGVAYSLTYFMFEDEELSFVENSNHLEGNVYPNLLLGNFLHNGSNPLIRKEAIESVGLFDSTIKAVEDWEYYIRLAQKWEFVLVPKPQVYYRQHIGSIASNIEIMQKHSLDLIEQVFQSVPEELQSIKSRSLALTHQYAAQKYLNFANQNPANFRHAAHQIWLASCMCPKILLDSFTYSLIKWLLKSWLFHKLSLSS